jgi:hypothetical protein
MINHHLPARRAKQQPSPYLSVMAPCQMAAYDEMKVAIGYPWHQKNQH